ncbi:alpha-D-ribose 1-methylphosphonate 5-triphosphate synthase subunit PhnG [Rhodovulum sp. ES.010]|uniref:phosphonate C-P lyase system protein PhnG n=1 Tax=Rhodovulum sp. ES.010 TaxID=1882821 RepID=UPI00092BC721|nr:phosphonate C-P lyase system protein PhnG [Rhodovulum sp. ES.010]SIO05268.1 alpha-D-ribose 1-methylphosphonate 5-triphosphate synthase subunit PhnG [Rhodovulum sp. ES.010]
MGDLNNRPGWMGLLAKAPAETLGELWKSLGPEPGFVWLRPPETGGVMVRGRMGGTGAPFNLGEMTVTRCALRLEGGEAVGHAYVQGRDKDKARRAALADALMQTDRADDVRTRLLEPLAAGLAEARRARAGRAAATKVEFFTMLRGED